ncbi:MAG: NAD(P)/FAD-dependent oxidoreductase, partial [Bacteroidota bacterium]
MLATDYLIIGSGAVGMAFTDILLTETKTTITIIDKFQKPGGHWNRAYPFVTLHQPSAFYGVSSFELGNDQLDQVGLNKGLNSLASGSEINAYYERIMKERFLPSGRVSYFPLCAYTGDGKFKSMITGKGYEID